MGFLKSEGKELSSGPSVEDVISLLKLVDDKTISANSGKVVLEKMVKEDKKPQEIIKEENMQQISNSAEIENFVQEAVKNNPQAVQDFISGNEKAKSAIIGFVMGKTKGQADPRLVDEMVVKLVKKG